jgi:hypothetical protein
VANSYGIPIHCRHMNADTCTSSSNFQANARAWRQVESEKVLHQHALFQSEEGNGVEEHPVPAVAATAHHLDDQIETSLLKLVRGVHLSHIHPVRNVTLCFREDTSIISIVLIYTIGLDDAHPSPLHSTYA